MYKKIFCVSLSTALLLAPMQSRAVDLGAAFNGLLGNGAATINSPGAFSSQARSGFTAGGVEVRVPRMSGSLPQLLSVTPPRISAGCQGISAHFGGFSFISGAEFGRLLKQIASGAALGFVTSLVMKTLCPPCEAIVQELKTAAAMAAKLAKDSCQWGQEKGDAFRQGLGLGPAKEMNCSQIVANKDGTADSLQAWSGVCNSITSAGEEVKKWLTPDAEDTTTPEGKEKAAATAGVLACQEGMGNLTWARLTAFDAVPSTASEQEIADATKRKLLLLNIMGAELGNGGPEDKASCETGGYTFSMKDDSKGPAPDSHYCAPPADTKVLTGLFLCGAPDVGGAVAADTTSSRVKAYCGSFFGNTPDKVQATTKLWTCDDGPEKCLNLKLTDASNVIAGTGFMLNVNKLLLDAVERVKTGAGFADEQGKQIIRLIQSAPYPLYQAINAAAVYPSAGTDLMDSMSILVGEHFAYAMLDETLKVTNRQGKPNCALSQPQAAKMLDFITGFRAENKARLTLIGQNFATQQGIARQIQEINQAIQQQTMSEDLLGSSRMSESINHAVTPMSKVTP